MFLNNINQPDKTNKNYDRFWKIGIVCDRLTVFYNTSKRSAVAKVTVLFKWEVTF
jgi:hypothetical protein